MKKLKVLLFCFILFISCEVSKFQTLEPAFIKINSSILLNNTNQSISHNLRDVWIYLDDINYGAFTPPCIIPVLETGKRKIQLFPGIRYYGIISKPEIYTVIQPLEFSQSFTINDTFTYTPSFKYKSNISISLDDGFESGSVFVNDLDKFPNTKLIRSSNYYKEGNTGLLATINKTDHTIESSTSFFKLANKNNSFLELDIQSDIEVSIGVITFPSGAINYFLKVKPTSVWKKIYIPLFEVLADTNEENFQIAVRSSLPDTLSTGFFALDNIRVLSTL